MLSSRCGRRRAPRRAGAHRRGQGRVTTNRFVPSTRAGEQEKRRVAREVFGVTILRQAGALPLAVAVLFAVTAHADYMDHFVVREDVGVHKAPSLGAGELLVMPLEVEGHPPFDRAELERFFSSDFVDYLRTASLGRYQPHVTVGPTIHYERCPLPADAFPDCKVKRGDLAAFGAAIDMIRDVVRRTDQE